jgi:hypothetical protein
MPTGSSDTANDFAKLDIAMGGSGLYQDTATAAQRWLAGNDSPFRGVFAGNFYSGLDGQGSYGDVWSSSFYPSYSSVAFSALFNLSYVIPGNGDYRSYGFAVRCALD